MRLSAVTVAVLVGLGLVAGCRGGGGSPGGGGTDSDGMETESGSASHGEDTEGEETDGEETGGETQDGDGVCGDGVVEGEEICDLGEDNGAAGSACQEDCTAATVDFDVRTVPLDNSVVFGRGPMSVHAGDVDGDGWLDVAVSDVVSGDIATVLGTQTGDLVTAKAVPAMDLVRGIARGNFVGDERTDVVVITGPDDFDSLNLEVYVANDSGLQFHDDYPVPVFLDFVSSQGTFDMEVADMTGDGKDDLLLATRNTSWLLIEGTGDGLGDATEVPGVNDGAVVDLEVADLDDDGDLDVVVSGGLGAHTVIADGALLGTGAILPDTYYMNELTLADVTGDGILDAIGGRTEEINVWEGPLDAATVTTVPIDEPFEEIGFIMGVGAGDFDGDGGTDILVSHFAGVTPLMKTGNTWESAGRIELPADYWLQDREPIVGDFDDDGDADVLLAGVQELNSLYSIGVIHRFEGGGGGLTLGPNAPAANGIAGERLDGAVAFGDVTGDDLPELLYAVSNRGGDEHGMLTQTLRPDGSLANAQTVPSSFGQAGPLLPADTNGDALADLVFTWLGSMGVTSLQQNEVAGFHDGFGVPRYFTEPDALELLLGGDEPQLGPVALYGDGAAVAERQTGTVYVVDDLEDGQELTGFGNVPMPSAIAVADVAGDGELDVLVASESLDEVHVFVRSGASFEAGAVVEIGDGRQGRGSSSLAVGDLDGDGHLDLVTANADSEDVAVLFGDGDGFGAPTFIEPTAQAGGAIAVALGDLDGDGVLDLAVANRHRDSVSVLLGLGDGSFAAPREIGVGVAPVDLAIADYDQDGRGDIVTADLGDDALTLLLSREGGDAWMPEDPDVERTDVANVVFTHDCAVQDGLPFEPLPDEHAQRVQTRDAELFVVAMESGDGNVLAPATVTVDRGTEVHLVLSSTTSVSWDVFAEPGTTIASVLINSPGNSFVDAPGTAEVLDYAGPDQEILYGPLDYATSQGQTLARTGEALTGVPLTASVGCSTATSFLIE